MFNVKEAIQIPIVIHQPDKKSKERVRGEIEGYIPDLNLSVYGSDFIEVIASASFSASSMYFYNKERNLELPLTTSYADAEKLLFGKRDFVTLIPLTV